MFQTELNNGASGTEKSAAQYGLALAYMKNKEFNKAHEALEPLLAEDPNRIAYVVAKAEIYTEGNEAGRAQDFLARPLQISPDNHPLTMTYADALIAARKYEEAARVLEKHAVNRPEDHDLWYAIAETQGLVGNVSKVHQARAEYFILIGDFKSASEQLSYALRIESDKENNGPLVAKLRQRSRDVETLDRNSRGR
jgi:predicted Zn-dependent protease